MLILVSSISRTTTVYIYNDNGQIDRQLNINRIFAIVINNIISGTRIRNQNNNNNKGTSIIII